MATNQVKKEMVSTIHITEQIVDWAVIFVIKLPY